MGFDDYNYGLFNKFILVKKPEFESELNEKNLNQFERFEQTADESIVYFKQEEI